MKKKILNAAVLIGAAMSFQAAHADQVFSYTESFTNPLDTQSTFVLSGLFSESASGQLTNLGSTILENGQFKLTLNVESMSARRFIQLPDALFGLPLQIDGFFIGPGGNRNTISSCGQVRLNGSGCAAWQSADPSVVAQGLTNVRSFGADAGGYELSSDTFSQTGALQLSAVPEPMTLAMFLAGLSWLAMASRKLTRRV